MNSSNPRNFRFCPVCSGDLREKFVHDENTKRLICQNCGFVFYMNPVPAVAVILFQNDEILLVKRKFPPQAGDWTLPAGFMEYWESPEECAIRETKEETNLDIRISGIFAALPGSYEMQIQIVLIVYHGKIIGGDLRPGDDAIEANFFPLDNLPENVAFSAHREVLKRLQKEQNIQIGE
ncbi:MAG: NUDIX hydrolase [Calditrichaeota bacterium]|nr:NUDIX hydrolase [Calditrichota bacterium]